MNNKIIKNKFGFFELEEKPTKEELSKYYQDKYYQEDMALYRHTYTDDEATFLKNKIRRKHHIISNICAAGKSLLDIGCGEGWILQYFYDHDWKVLGLDHNSFAIEQHNPAMLNYFLQGDFYETLSQLKEKYDVIWMENVLEHVLNPELLLQQITKIMHSKSLLLITVPNDFSILQRRLFELNFIDVPFWVTPPDHISYFNQEGLIQLCFTAGLKNECNMADFPIDFNLYNEDTNYVKSPSKGHNVHLSRVVIENLLSEISISKSVDLYKILAKMGLGRNITSFFTLL
jgi:2-polyprenyl-3-methyl-5-hydroxy-6-metoxy-1,4-benzoquinol methylase